MAWVMRRADWHVFQVLTKRSSRLRNFLLGHPEVAALPNVWWGVSVEDRTHGLPRVEHLRQAPAAVRCDGDCRGQDVATTDRPRQR